MNDESTVNGGGFSEPPPPADNERPHQHQPPCPVGMLRIHGWGRTLFDVPVDVSTGVVSWYTFPDEWKALTFSAEYQATSVDHYPYEIEYTGGQWRLVFRGYVYVLLKDDFYRPAEAALHMRRLDKAQWDRGDDDFRYSFGVDVLGMDTGTINQDAVWRMCEDATVISAFEATLAGARWLRRVLIDRGMIPPKWDEA